MERFHSYSELDTEILGEKIALSASPGDFIALFGEMGSGKTVFRKS